MIKYTRVIPRDLFNEANFLKCIATLFILTENMEGVCFSEDSLTSFNIGQSSSDGGLYISNLKFLVFGEEYCLTRPLNSREPWPLYIDCGEDITEVFDCSGNLSEEFKDLVKTQKGSRK